MELPEPPGDPSGTLALDDGREPPVSGCGGWGLQSSQPPSTEGPAVERVVVRLRAMGSVTIRPVKPTTTCTFLFAEAP